MDIKLSVYDKIFRFFISEAGGCVMAVTHDLLFLKTLKGAFKSLGLDSRGFLHRNSMNKAVEEAKSALKIFSEMVFFIEARSEASSNIPAINNLKSFFQSKCKLIVITAETERHNIIYMYEMGADNVIVKPVSINSLIQKVALTLNPNNKLARLVDQARNLLLENKLDEAGKALQSIIKLKPDSAIAFILKGDLARKQKDYAQAEQCYLKACSHSKMFLDPLKRLSELYAETGEISKKLDYLKKLDRLSPLNFQRKVNIGHTYLDLDNHEQAVKYYDEAIRQVQKQALDMVSSTMMQIAGPLEKKAPELGSDYIARAIANKGSSFGREDLWMINEIGMSLRHQGKWEQSVEYYKKGTGIAPMDGGLYYNMGLAFVQGKEYYKALDCFQKAIDFSPDILSQSPSVPYNIARTYHALKRREEALKYVRSALKLDPGFESALKLLSILKQ